MIFLIYIPNLLATVDLVVSEIIRTDGRQTARQTETGDLFFRTLQVTPRRENMKVASHPMESYFDTTPLAPVA